MESSPFPHQGPLTAEQVRGRRDLVDDLVERATQRRVTALLGPRRYGKTSVLRKVESVLNESVEVIWLDFYETMSTADLVVRIDEALSSTSGAMRKHLSGLAASASLNLGMFKVEFSRPARQRPDPDASLHRVLDLLVAAATSTPTVIIIDEFTGINSVAGAAGLLRTKLQHHIQDVGLLFAGSEPTAMVTMFTDSAQPFYAQADLVDIEPFSTADLAMIVDTGFAETDRDPGPLAAQVHQFTGGHPYRSMQITDACWRRAEPGAAWIDTIFAEGLAQLRGNVASSMEVTFSAFDQSEQAVLRALASQRPVFGGSLELYGSSSGGATAGRDRLVADGTLSRHDHEIIDPFLADWIRLRFAL